MDENSVFVVFNFVNEWSTIAINCLFGTKVNNTLDAWWQLLLNKLQCTDTASADSNFSISFPSLSWSTSFFFTS